MAKIPATRKKILDTAIMLIKEKGFRGVTTKEIARHAGVNEVTIFRHFGKKSNILESIIEEYSYLPSFKKMIEDEIQWDLKKDLETITKVYFSYFEKNNDLIKIAYKELGSFPSLDKKISSVPLHLKMILIQYLDEMETRGKIKKCDSEAIATAYIAMNYGYLVSKLIHNHDFDIKEDAFIKNGISFFYSLLDKELS